MKGKIAFVLGAAVGYVLGTRAGRERYEQIKRGAQTVWNTEPVQKGVGVVKGAIDERADEVKAFVRRASSDAFAKFAQQTAPKDQPKTRSTERSSSARSSSTQSRPASPSGAAASAAQRGATRSEAAEGVASAAADKASE